MLPLTTFMTKAVRKSSRLVLRDYFELENLQSTRSNEEFVKKSVDRGSQTLYDEVTKYPNSAILDKDTDGLKECTYFTYNVIDSTTNFARAIPFFATTLVSYEYRMGRFTPKACVVEFPALGDVVYAEAGIGAFIEKAYSHISDATTKLRVSKVPNLDKALVSSDESIPGSLVFGSVSYGGCLVASGKVDLFFSDSTSSKAIVDGLSFITKEAGGRYYINQEHFGRKAGLILSNNSIS